VRISTLRKKLAALSITNYKIVVMACLEVTLKQAQKPAAVADSEVGLMEPHSTDRRLARRGRY